VLKPLLIALQFLTRLPVRTGDWSDRDVGRSMLFYPLVGLLLGLALAVVGVALRGGAPAVVAAVLLGLWVFATGALHLDGLADSADAWIGGFGDPQRTLDIMRDPHCGPAAVAVVTVVLIAKFAALQALITTNALLAVATAPVLGRTVLPLLFVTTRYVRIDGVGAVLAERLPRRSAVAVVVCFALAACIANLWMTLTAAIVFVALRALMVHRIGGTTGDTAGTTVELVETATLVVASLAR
jgi:adenosylcobinamide-GDP ribazoletransferase